MDKNRSGYLVVEALIALAILGLLVVSVFPTINFMLKRNVRSKYDAEENFYLQEGIEVAYHVLISSSNWDTYPTGQSYQPVHNGSWSLVAGEDTNLETRFNRKVEIESVCRDAATGVRDIAGCVPDADSRLVVATINCSDANDCKPVSAEFMVIKPVAKSVVPDGLPGVCQVKFNETDHLFCNLSVTPLSITATVVLAPPSSKLQMAFHQVLPTLTDTVYTSEPALAGRTYTIYGDWPGIQAGDTVVEIHAGLNVLDPHGNPLVPACTASLDYYAYPWGCPWP